MGFFNSVLSLPGQAIRDARKTIDRITGVEAERQTAKRETRRLKQELASVKELVRKVPKTPARLSKAKVDDKLANRNFATKKGLRRLSYSYNGRLLELQLDMTELEKDVATDLKALKSAVEQAQKEQQESVEKAMEALTERLEKMEEAAEKAAEVQEKSLSQVSDELGDLRTYTQTLDAEQAKKAESMRFLQGPLVGILTNLVTALNASDRPVNPVGIYISEGVEAYTKLEASNNVDPDAMRWLEIAALAARLYAYYDSNQGFSSVFGPDKQIREPIGKDAFQLNTDLRETLKDLQDLEARLNERLRDEE